MARSLGLRADGAFFDDYREFCGLWSEEEYRSFLAAQEDNSRVDEEDWA